MPFRVSWIYKILIVFQFIHHSTEVEYEFIPRDERIYKKCKDMPGVLDISGMFDMSKLNLTMVEEGIHTSGNITITWSGLDLSDRIQMAASVEYFDRGTWVPTILNLLIPDFCKVLYDEKQFWYGGWASHITNRKEIEKECIKVPGVSKGLHLTSFCSVSLTMIILLQTVLIFETFMARYRFGSGIVLRPGRYLIRFYYTAYDKFNIKRPTEICFEIMGEFEKVLKY
ncbi:hypothetical protein KR032_007868 [Drosophila birchii]|nr:hypothetical protein KR032_007868 [Drosophila birchii]